ncbi:MAG: cell division protein FtsI (penicillin-binding protein 3) [Pseudoalteromonas tetraodonis]|jgi:cell division protein FtsI (penicillin-binding protein 3)
MLTCFVLVFVFTCLSARLIYVQIIKHDEYAYRAMEQRTRKVVLTAGRGRIFDVSGELFVDNFPTQNISVDRKTLRNIDICTRGLAHAAGLRPRAYRSLYPDEEIRQRYAERVAHLIDGAIGEEAANKIREIAKEDSTRKWLPLAKNLDNDVAARLEKILKQEKLSGLLFEESTKRFYPNPRSGSHVLGLVSDDGGGQFGIEREFNSALSGVDGSRWVERDGHQEEIAKYRGEEIAPQDGNDIYLTIDMTLQSIVEHAIKRLVDQHAPEKVSVVLMDPFTGKVMAMACYPDFDLEARTKGNKRNFAISDRYEPGSTMKVFSLSACYDSGFVTPGEVIFCHNGRYDEGPRYKVLSDHHPYGYLTSGMVLAKSSNIGTYMMVKEMGRADLHSYTRAFGFGARTGIALTGESGGLVLKPNSRHWSNTTLSRMSIGYEIDVTPLQMVTALCAVANGGNLMQPQIIEKIASPEGETLYSYKPHKVHRVIREETADQVRSDMQLVLGEDGTGKLGRVEGYSVAGKTGTARKLNKDRRKGYKTGHYVVSFMGFLPAENPRLAAIVVIDDPIGEGVMRYGGTVAAPVFSAIATEAMKHMGVDPSIVPRRAVRSKGPMGSSIRYAPPRAG